MRSKNIARALLRQRKYKRIAHALRIMDELIENRVLTQAEAIQSKRAASSLCRILQWKPEFRRMVAARNGQHEREFSAYMTPSEVATQLLVTPVTVRGWAAKGILRAVKTPGGHRRFLIRDVKQFAQERKLHESL